METSSALFWLPRIEEGLLPTPETVTIAYDHGVCLGIEDPPGSPTSEAAYEELTRVRELVDVAMIEGIGRPAFLRTDLSSAKHDGPNSYEVRQAHDITQRLGRTVIDNELKFPFGPTPQAFLVRQWLYITWSFKAFGGHPIGREWRYFASPDTLECRHFYWPADAMQNPDEPDWRQRLHHLEHDVEPPEGLARYAVAAAGLCGGSWSVDFAETTGGRWYLIDMAPANLSWHPDH